MINRPALVRLLTGPTGGMVMGGIWLVFLAMPLYSLWVAGNTPQRWVGLVAVAVFVPTYLGMFRTMGFLLDERGRRVQLRGIALIAAIIVVLAWAIGPTAVSMLPFLAGVTAFGLWPPIRLPATVMIVVAGLVWVAWTGWHAGRLIPVGIAVLVGAAGILTSLEVEHHSALANADQERAIAEQREQLARDVHDVVGHTLTVANLQLQLADRLFDADPERARAALRQTQELLVGAHEEIRRTVSASHHRTLSQELAQVTAALRASGLNVEVVGKPPLDEGRLERVLTWVLRESATNVLRHAQANRVVVTFGEGEFRLTDDGVGPGDGQGNGLRGMAERVVAAGAEFSFGPGECGGSQVRVRW